MAGLGQVLMGLLAVFAWGAPVLLAKLFADTLDSVPYLIALAIGVGLGGSLFVARWRALRAALANPPTARVALVATLIVVAFCPTWAMGVGLGANRVLDRSSPVAHECRVLEWQQPAKGRARCLVTSWRGNRDEIVSDALVADAADGGSVAFPSACTPGQVVVVTTRAGALGWEWIENVRRL